MILPQAVQWIIQRLQACGFEAYAVGGCVRDALRGAHPHDWDICTSATPKEMHHCFSGYRVVDTGLQHGTITLVLDSSPYEITTFRKDGSYRDHRHPEQVSFVRDLEEDLARRDFTVNAMAADQDGVIHDFHHGQEDLAAGIIRCVGNPSTRFQEDALRILRALRFASVLDFQIDPETVRAAYALRELLRMISTERIYSELNKLLVGPGAGRVLRDYRDIFAVILPEICPAVGFQQHNPCHYQDVWEHTLTAFSMSVPDRLVRWTLLLHDLGKPQTFSLDEKGIGHFYHHPEVSQKIAAEIFDRLHADRDTKSRVCRLVLYHDAWPPGTMAGVLRWQREFGLDDLKRLAEVRRCDGNAHTDHPRMQPIRASTEIFSDLVAQLSSAPLPYRIADLAVNGKDLMALGFHPGKQLGILLNNLLDAVIDGQCANTRETLLQYAAQYLHSDLSN